MGRTFDENKKEVFNTMKHIRPLVALAAIVMVIASAFGTQGSKPAQASGGCTPSHVVRPGENLFRIGLIYNVAWPVLQHINRISNPNRVHVGQIICLPTGSAPRTPPIVVPTPAPGAPVVTPPPATGGVYFPPAGVFPAIDFNTRNARVGSTIVITGVRFPGNRDVQIFITPTGTEFPATPVGAARTNADGTLNTNFTIPADSGGAALTGWGFRILVRDPVSGYFAFNWIRNS
jgi:LysM domain